MKLIFSFICVDLRTTVTFHTFKLIFEIYYVHNILAFLQTRKKFVLKLGIIIENKSEKQIPSMILIKISKQTQEKNFNLIFFS